MNEWINESMNQSIRKLSITESNERFTKTEIKILDVEESIKIFPKTRRAPISAHTSAKAPKLKIKNLNLEPWSQMRIGRNVKNTVFTGDCP